MPSLRFASPRIPLAALAFAALALAAFALAALAFARTAFADIAAPPEFRAYAAGDDPALEAALLAR